MIPTDGGPHSRRKSSRPPSASSTGSAVTPLSAAAQRSPDYVNIKPLAFYMEPTYVNIKPKEPRLGLMHHDSDAQATYQNLHVGMGAASSPMVSDSSSYLSASPPRVSGPKMAFYAQLDFSRPPTSNPKGKGGDGHERKRSSEDGEIYMTLNLSGVAPPPNKTPEPMETSRTRHSPPPTQI